MAEKDEFDELLDRIIVDEKYVRPAFTAIRPDWETGPNPIVYQKLPGGCYLYTGTVEMPAFAAAYASGR